MRKIVRRMHCPDTECGHTWIATLTEQYGIENFDNDKEVYCKYCGSEGITGFEVTESEFMEAI